MDLAFGWVLSRHLLQPNSSSAQYDAVFADTQFDEETHVCQIKQFQSWLPWTRFCGQEAAFEDVACYAALISVLPSLSGQLSSRHTFFCSVS